MQSRIYDFEPQALAQLETAMWRAYYDKRVLALFKLSLHMLQEQLGFSLPQALVGAYRLTAAAFVFKRGKKRADYVKALRWLVPFYKKAQQVHNGQWQAEEVARLELEWWIIHRHEFGPGNTAKLESGLAQLASQLYHIPVRNLQNYGEYRAQAMLISDGINQRKNNGEVFEPNWKGIETALYQSFSSLSQQIQAKMAEKSA